MKTTSHQWFSFIEIVIAVGLIIILASIGVTYSEWMKDKTHNSRIISEIQTLENSFQAFVDDTKTPILPSWNKQFFKEDTGYAHSIDDAYGVSGFVTDTTIPKQYINFLPRDPRTQQFYALGTHLESWAFEVAGVVRNYETFQSRVSGNYVGNVGPINLIKEYNGPNFVRNTSYQYFPYNPQESLLTAKIGSFSWVVNINHKSYDDQTLTQLELFEWDSIQVGIGSYAELFMSDGSVALLWDTMSPTTLQLKEMRFTEKSNLLTNIVVFLDMWNIWIRAASLWQDSVFEMHTNHGVAAIRGTIFGMRSEASDSSVTVVEWVVEVKNTQTGNTPSPSQTITVKKWEAWQAIKISWWTEDGWYTLTKSPEYIQKKIQEQAGSINENIKLEILSFDTLGKKLTLALSPTLRMATKVVVTGADNTPQETSLDYEHQLKNQESITFDKDVLWEEQHTISLKLCDTHHCTQALTLHMGNEIMYNVWEEVCDGIKVGTNCEKNTLQGDWELVAYGVPKNGEYIFYGKDWQEKNDLKNEDESYSFGSIIESEDYAFEFNIWEFPNNSQSYLLQTKSLVLDINYDQDTQNIQLRDSIGIFWSTPIYKKLKSQELYVIHEWWENKLKSSTLQNTNNKSTTWFIDNVKFDLNNAWDIQYIKIYEKK